MYNFLKNKSIIFVNVGIVLALLILVAILYPRGEENPYPIISEENSSISSNYSDSASTDMVFPEYGGIAVVGDSNLTESRSASTKEKADFQTQDVSTPEFGQKIIKNGNAEILVKDVDNALEKVTKMVQENGGYIQNATANTDMNGNKSVNMSVMILAENFDKTGESLKELGDVTNMGVWSNDITTEYIDTEARLKTLKTQETTLLNILTKATKVEDMILIETELQRIRENIESSQAQIKYWDKAVTYSEMSIHIYSHNVPTKVVEDRSIGEIIQFNFKDGLGFWGKAVVTILAAFVWVLPAGVVLALCLTIIKFAFDRRKEKKSSEKKPDNDEK